MAELTNEELISNMHTEVERALATETVTTSLIKAATQTSNFTVPTVDSYRIPVDSTSSPLTVTLNDSAEEDTRILVYDANNSCGTNSVTIESGAQVEITKLSSNQASVEIVKDNGSWAIVSRYENLFDRDDATTTVTLNKTGDTFAAGSFTATDGEFGQAGTTTNRTVANSDFTNIGANVVQNPTYFDNNNATTDNTFDTNLATASSGTFAPGTFKVYDDTDTLISGSGKVNVGYAVDGDSLPTGTDPVYPLINTGVNTPFAITADSEDLGAGDKIHNAFDNDTGTQWISANGVTYPTHINIDLGASNEQVFNAFRFTGAGTTTRAIADCTVEGSATGAFVGEEVTLVSVTGAPANNMTTWSDLYNFSATGSYRYYRIKITANNGHSYVSCAQFEFRQAVLQDQTAFQALANQSYTTQFDLILQGVGAQKISRATLSTPDQKFEVGTDGTVTYKANDIKYAKVSPDGVELPSLTTAQRDAVSAPTAGLIIFNSTTSKLNFYTGSAWEAVTSA